MDIVVVFFRDILSGTTYTVTAIVCSILICSCMGYLIDKKDKKKALASQYTGVETLTVNQTTTSQPVMNTTPQPEAVPVPQEPTPVPQEEVKPNPQSEAAPAPQQKETQPEVLMPAEEEHKDEVVFAPEANPAPIEEIVESQSFEKPSLNDVEVKGEPIQEPIVSEEKPQAIKTPVPIKEDVVSAPQPLEVPLAPNNEESAGPIPTIN